MNLPKGYKWITRGDLQKTHIAHASGTTLLCCHITIIDAQPIPEGIKPLCTRCEALLEDCAAIAEWRRQG